jgi:hypothetical protein
VLTRNRKLLFFPERTATNRKKSHGLIDVQSVATDDFSSGSRIARLGSAYFVLTRRGKAPLLARPQHSGRAISDARR